MNEVSNDNKNFFFHPRCTLHFKEKKEKSSLSCTSIVSHFFFFFWTHRVLSFTVPLLIEVKLNLSFLLTLPTLENSRSLITTANDNL